MSYYSHYKKWHPDVDLSHEHMIQFYTGLFCKTLDHLPRGAALDAGCGTGAMMEYLIRNGFEPVFGYDAEPEMVNICNSRGLKVVKSLEAAIISQFGIEFQVISALDFLEHLTAEQALKTCASFYSHLKDGGVFICTVPNANSVLAERWRYIDPTHRVSFTECTLDYLLRESGFNRVSIMPAEWPLKLNCRSWSAFVTSLRLKIARSFRRFQLLAELGEYGRHIPLSLNLMGIAWK